MDPVVDLRSDTVTLPSQGMREAIARAAGPALAEEGDRIVAEAEEKAARMRKDTSFLIEQQIKQLRKDLTRQAASAAVVAAEELLQKSTTESDQDQLAESYLNRLDEVIEERQS